MSNISSILSSPQRISENLSSRQLFTILDDLIARALLPLAHTSSSFHELIAEILASSLFTRRRLSDAQLTHLFHSFFLPPEQAIKAVQEANVDRAHLFGYLFRVGEHGKEYAEATTEHARHESRAPQTVLRVIYDKQRILGSSKQLGPALADSAFWTRTANDFKARIIEKYVKLIFSRASRTARTSTFTVDVRDVFSSGYITASRAADKFVSDKGVFTTYLSRWLNGTVKTRHTNGLGLSFGSSSRYAEGTGFSVPLDDVPDVSDGITVEIDESDVLLSRLTLAADDPDVRAALLVSGVVPAGVPRGPSKTDRVNNSQSGSQPRLTKPNGDVR